jgi:hypothetical protein
MDSTSSPPSIFTQSNLDFLNSCEGPVLWRGHFNATGTEKSVNLSINGGEAFAASVWLNGKFVKTTYGKSTYPAYIWPIIDPAIEETDEVFTFPKGALVAGKNVITVLQDNVSSVSLLGWRWIYWGYRPG